MLGTINPEILFLQQEGQIRGRSFGYEDDPENHQEGYL